MGAVLSDADEVAVERFLAREIPFTAIAEVVRRAMDLHQVQNRPKSEPELEDIFAADAWAREFARRSG
jgi:1-deoxy-D-xylulose-5-phosphate reductoisomerase